MPYIDKYLRPKEKGLCVDCPRPIVPGRSKCPKHYLRDSQYRKIRRQLDPLWAEQEKQRAMVEYERRKDEHRCTRCGQPLTEDDENYATCTVCRIKRQGNYQDIMPIGTYKGGL